LGWRIMVSPRSKVFFQDLICFRLLSLALTTAGSWVVQEFE
jgi:hypothetical protein